MQKSGLMLVAVLTAVFPHPCKPEIELDCEQSSLQMDYNDGLPLFEIDLHSESGTMYDTVLEVYEVETDIPGGASCNWRSFGGNGWAIEGDFTQATYGIVPEGAEQVWPPDGDEYYSTELVDGVVYMAQGSHKAWRGYQDYCNSLNIVWVQGDPESVIWCGTIEEEE